MTNRRQEIEARAEQRAQDITVPNLAKVNIQINDIDPDPNQPRESFMEHRLQELSESLAANGVLVPIIVHRHPNQPNRYVIVDGEQRWRASQLANKTDIPAHITNETDPIKLLELQLTINNQRDDVHELERGDGVYRILEARLKSWNSTDDLNTILSIIAARARNQQPAVSPQTRAFLDEHEHEIKQTIEISGGLRIRSFWQTVVQIRTNAPEVFRAAIAHKLSVRTADLLARITDPNQRAELVEQAKLGHWTYKQTLEAINQRKTKPSKKPRTQHVIRLLKNLSHHYGQLSPDAITDLEPILKKLEQTLEKHGLANVFAKPGKTAIPATDTQS